MLLHYFFDLTSFKRLGQKSKNFIGFWGDLKTPKGHFKINWPLDAYVAWSHAQLTQKILNGI